MDFFQVVTGVFIVRDAVTPSKPTPIIYKAVLAHSIEEAVKLAGAQLAFPQEDCRGKTSLLVADSFGNEYVLEEIPLITKKKYNLLVSVFQSP